ncbi:hypothetical protein TCAL_16766 [Tigriopus californicus]|uniref:Uncharacterized protein n=1 Tax=Tigriopus californicus TaxID=6832 RepID=A0A553PSJ6_TIGCA|nr:hypothetical protein TCAL_16766 [Tigriopus californicus]
MPVNDSNQAPAPQPEALPHPESLVEASDQSDMIQMDLTNSESKALPSLNYDYYEYYYDFASKAPPAASAKLDKATDTPLSTSFGTSIGQGVKASSAIYGKQNQGSTQASTKLAQRRRMALLRQQLQQRLALQKQRQQQLLQKQHFGFDSGLDTQDYYDVMLEDPSATSLGNRQGLGVAGSLGKKNQGKLNLVGTRRFAQGSADFGDFSDLSGFGGGSSGLGSFDARIIVLKKKKNSDDDGMFGGLTDIFGDLDIDYETFALILGAAGALAAYVLYTVILDAGKRSFGRVLIDDGPSFLSQLSDHLWSETYTDKSSVNQAPNLIMNGIVNFITHLSQTAGQGRSSQAGAASTDVEAAASSGYGHSGYGGGGHFVYADEEEECETGLNPFLLAATAAIAAGAAFLIFNQVTTGGKKKRSIADVFSSTLELMSKIFGNEGPISSGSEDHSVAYGNLAPIDDSHIKYVQSYEYDCSTGGINPLLALATLGITLAATYILFTQVTGRRRRRDLSFIAIIGFESQGKVPLLI